MTTLAAAALSAVREGTDVYLFLIGIIGIAELAGTHGVYEWIGQMVGRAAAASPARVFWLVFGLGAIITTLLSNDTTILLLTPAAIAIARRAGVSPVAPAYATAFIANAASFVLPISNPANLLLYPHLPPAAAWLATFGASSLVAIAVTGAVLFFCLREDRRSRSQRDESPIQAQSAALRPTIAVVALSCVALVGAAWFRLDIGVTALACACGSIAIVSIVSRDALVRVLREGQWSIVVLVAALLVAIKFAGRLGAVTALQSLVAHFNAFHHPAGVLATGASIAILANVFNNLPAAVLAHFGAANNPAALVGIDLGPNAALSGSLATILWSGILRKAGIRVTAIDFLRIGVVTTLPALAAALLALR